MTNETYEVHDPENQYPINEIYCFLSIDENGNEGLVMARDLPLITSRADLAERMTDFVQAELKPLTKKKIRLVKFTNKEIVREL